MTEACPINLPRKSSCYTIDPLKSEDTCRKKKPSNEVRNYGASSRWHCPPHPNIADQSNQSVIKSREHASCTKTKKNVEKQEWRTMVKGGWLTNSYSSNSWMSAAGMKVWNPCRKAFIWGWMARVIRSSVTSWTYSAWKTAHARTHAHTQIKINHQHW